MRRKMGTKINARAARLYARILVFYALHQADVSAMSYTIEASKISELLEIPEDREPVKIALESCQIAGERVKRSATGITLDLASHRGLSPAESVRVVFEYWRTTTGKRGKLSEKRKTKIKARLREGYTVEDLKLAIDGLSASDWHNGRNPRTQGRKYLELEQVTRDGTRVEKFMAMGARQREQESRSDIFKLIGR